MKILLVDNNHSLLKYIEECLADTGNEISHIEEPSKQAELFLASLMQEVNSYHPDCIFSVNFYPIISLACGVMHVKYVSWIVDAFLDNSYDYSIKNGWNEVFVADADLYKICGEGENIHYLPLGVTEKHNGNEKLEPSKDILIWSDTVSDTQTIAIKLDELKDSTKGYIDSMIEQRKNNLTEWRLYDFFADYAKKDIEEHYPLEQNSLETLSHKYDRYYLFNAMEKTYGFPYLVFALAPWDIDAKIDIALANIDTIKLENKNVSKILQEDIISSDYALMRDYKMVVFLPSIENGNKIPTELWNIMALGIPVLVPEWIDMTGIPDLKVETFKHKRDMRNKLYDFIEDSGIREEYSSALKTVANENNSIEQRIRTIFNL